MRKFYLPLFLLLVMAINVACNLLSTVNTPSPAPLAGETSLATSESAVVETQPATSLPTDAPLVPVTGHLMEPAADVPRAERTTDDVESSGTGPEGRAPYGDSYAINRFERPFLQDMTYVSDMDIKKFSIAQDADWIYVSIQLIGSDPNNSLGIDYGVEIDPDGDGFGDYAIWAQPPYTTSWDTSTVQVYQDADHDTAGQSSAQSDAGAFDGNGYDTLVFDGAVGQNDDPDLAWVRMIEGENAVIQFAFKKSLVGSAFMLGVVSDAGLRDLTQYDYADSFQEADAGSPVSGKEFFPLGSLYAVDNTCWQPFGQNTNGLRSKKMCQAIVQPPNTPSAPKCTVEEISNCGGAYDPDTCECSGGAVP